MAASMCVSMSGFNLCSREFLALSGMRLQSRRSDGLSVGCNTYDLQSISTSGELVRRTGNHHGNLWDDRFIQSLTKQNENRTEPELEREKLIGEAKDMFNALATSSHLLERLSSVDIVERLGIDRHFQDEINGSLDYVYRYWDSERGAGRVRESSCTDLNTTALGLRILRLHRYNVSSEVLKHFQHKDGQFIFDSSSTIPQEQEIRSILNLFRASHIAFPREKVMDEAKGFSTAYLNQALENRCSSPTLSKEIELNLEYGWYGNLPRVEARNYIGIYSQDSSWVHHAISKKTMAQMTNKTLLELAKLDFNMMQKEHQQELQILMKIALGKLCTLLTCIDDIYDTHGTLDELSLFTDAVKRWHPSATHCLPEYMKIAYMALYNTVNGIGVEADKAQGCQTLQYSRKTWEAIIDAYLQEAKWIADGHVPRFDEYLENGGHSSGVRLVTLQPLLTLDAHLSEDILSRIDYPSRFNELLCLTFRLKGDAMTFKTEAARGEVASSVACYMRDHSGCTEEEALNCVIALLDDRLKELNWEYLMPDSVPNISKDFAYSTLRGLFLLYKERDGFSVSTMDVKNHGAKMLLQPVKM